MTSDYFEFEKDIYGNKFAINFNKQVVENINNALEVIQHEDYNNIQVTINQEKFSNNIENIREKLLKLQKSEEELFDKFTHTQQEKNNLENQFKIVLGSINELEKDYVFSVENVNDTVIECPICGTNHDNSLINRSSLLLDKKRNEDLLDEIAKDLEKVNSKIRKINSDTSKIKDQIDELNALYLIDPERENPITVDQVISTIGYMSIKNKIDSSKNENIISIKSLEESNKKFKKDQKALLTKEKESSLNNFFTTTLYSHLTKLNVSNVNLDKISSPMDYTRVTNIGGAANSTRAILAYYTTFLEQSIKYGESVKCPLVIDTPNQQEQSKTNYPGILDLILNSMTKDSQIFLCAMENEHLEDYKIVAKIIEIKTPSSSLLQNELYISLKQEFNVQFSSLIKSQI